MTDGLTVQQMAERTGLTAHTLRFYEREGLIPLVGRDGSSGHRRYNEEDVRRVSFLIKLRATGMPLREMQRFVDLSLQGDATLSERRAMLEAHRCSVRAQIDDLEQNLTVIETKINLYTRQDTKNSLCVTGMKETGNA